MSKSLSIVYSKRTSEQDFGYLNLRIIENRKTRRKSLKIRLTDSQFRNYFNENKQRFRKNSNFPEGKKYNEIIEKAFAKYELEESKEEDNISFLKYFQRKINLINNQGSKIKKQVVFGKLEKFLKYNGESDLLFHKISPQLAENLFYYFKNNKDPKKLSKNTAIHYIKIIKSIINKAQKEHKYVFKYDPFSSLGLKKGPTSPKYLKVEDLVKLTDSEVVEQFIEDARNLFLFQIFANGMRISDALMLRFSNFDNGRLKYKMQKTGIELELPLNVYLCVLLSKFHPDLYSFNDSKQNEKIALSFNNKKDYMNIYELNREIDKFNSYNISKKPERNEFLKELFDEDAESIGKLIRYHGYNLDTSSTNFEYLKYLIDRKQKLNEEIDKHFLENFFKSLQDYETDKKDEFIFPFLDKELFKNNESELTEAQYKHLKHKTIVINRILKKLQKLANIKSNISTHVARHTFANLILTTGEANMFEISRLFGHSSLQITEIYLRQNFDSSRLDDLSIGVQGKFRSKNL
jgi:integrase